MAEHRLVLFKDRSALRRPEFAVEVLGLVDVDQMLEVFPVSFARGLVLQRHDAPPRGELLELKAGFKMLPPAIAPFTRSSLASTLADGHENLWRDVVLDGLIDEHEIPPRPHGPIVVRCRECGRWNYHLSTCSRRFR